MSTIETCLDLRRLASEDVTNVLSRGDGKTERELCETIKISLASIPAVLKSGWYDPPAGGVAVLLASPEDNFERTRFDSLRKPEHWSDDEHRLASESVGILYVSPVKESGIIGDWGATVYRGNDERVQQHLVKCLETVEDLAEFSSVGMQFGEISHHAAGLLEQRGLTSGRTLLVSRQDATGVNCGHTVPWTDRMPNPDEQLIIDGHNQHAINNLIGQKRIFINANERQTIPATIAFTIELRLESVEDPTLPNVFFHLITCFDEGVKMTVSNFNPLFKAFGMDYIRSRYT